MFSKKDKAKEKALSMKCAPTMSGNYPFYTSFGDDIYASDIIVQAIRCKANEFKKLQPKHIRIESGTKVLIDDSSVSKVLANPNPYMTTADFFGKITILYELNKNVYIYPEYYISKEGKRYYTALYPLKPSNVTYLQDNKGDIFISLDFANGNNALFKSDELIHWRKDYGVNDFFGGGLFGGNDNRGLLKALSTYDKLTQAISKALECSCQINGIMRINSYLDDDSLKSNRENFVSGLNNNKSGILFVDNQIEYTHLPRDIKLVDAETVKFFYEAILRETGVSLAILNGDYTKAQKEAFYEHSLEADIKSLSQAMSKVMFSDREKGYGNEVALYPNNIVFMSMENKIAFAQIAAPSGMLLKDEFRELFGYPPLPNGQGQVISQGYNNLLDESNSNTLSSSDAQTQKGEK